jgi:hypothetical protein
MTLDRTSGERGGGASNNVVLVLKATTDLCLSLRHRQVLLCSCPAAVLSRRQAISRWVAAARNDAEFQRDFHHLMGPSVRNPAVSRE